MPGLALALLGIFGAVGFAGRIAIQIRMTGSTGVTGLSGRPGSVEWLGGVLFVASLVLLPAGLVLDLTDTLEPIAALDGDTGYAIGIALFAAGLAGTFWSQLAMGASWRIGVEEEERTDLVTGGPFGWVRNPIYSAMVPALCGVALLSPTVVSIAAIALLLLALEIQVRAVEEPYLMRSHPEYAAYAARVGRFVPGLGRLGPR